MIEWLQVNAGWLALPLAVVLAAIGWFIGIRPTLKRRSAIRIEQRGGAHSTNIQIANVKQGDKDADG